MNSKRKYENSYFIKKYNDLDGKNIDRQYLQQLKDKLSLELLIYEDKQLKIIFNKIVTLLKKHPKEDLFKINIKTFITIPKLNIENETDIKGLGLPFLKKPISEKITGLNKSISSNDIYNMITNKIIKLIKSSEKKLKWKKGWTSTFTGDYLIAYNYITKKPYRSINQFLLSFKGLKNPYFLTFKQIEKLKGKIKKGAKGHQVIYYTMLYLYKNKKSEFATYDKNKFVKYINKISQKPITEKNLSSRNLPKGVSILPIIKYYNVFNGSDIKGIDFNLNNFKLNGKVAKVKTTNDKIFIDNKEADKIIENYPKPVPELKHQGNKAFHQGIGSSLIVMPPKKQFNNSDSYYKTLFHEYSHSTGIVTRLNRKIGNKFGSKNYAFEELIAELSAVFLSNEVGIVGDHFKNSVAYLKSWNKVLIKELENDNKFIILASAKAQKSTDFILQRDKNGLPLYQKIISKKPNNKIDKNGQYGLFGVKELKKFGFEQASTNFVKPNNIFRLKGELGKFIQDIQPYKELIIIKGDKHSNKTQLAMQIANGLGELGKRVSYIDYEQGGLLSKDTQNSLRWNTNPNGAKNIQITGYLENPFIDLKEICKYSDAIIADSVTDLGISADQLNELRTGFPNVIWCFISQVKSNGEMYGGNKMAHNPTKIINCHTNEDYRERYATLEKNRGNDIELMYLISDKKLITKVPGQIETEEK